VNILVFFAKDNAMYNIVPIPKDEVTREDAHWFITIYNTVVDVQLHVMLCYYL
jgi:hypothetical protein